MYSLLYVAGRRSYVGTRTYPKLFSLWVSFSQPVRVPNRSRALTSAHRSAAQNGQPCTPKKNTRTFSPGHWFSAMTWNLP